MKRFAPLLPVLFLSVALTACGGQAREERARRQAERELERARQDLAEAREKLDEARDRVHEATGEETRPFLGQFFKDLGEALSGEAGPGPVDFRKLRELLPDEVAGFERTNVEGESAGAFGLDVSHARGRYTRDGADLEIEIVDLGALARTAEHGLDWLDAHVDRESSDWWERTTTVDGHPAYVKSHVWNDRSEFEATVFVADRFVVHASAGGRDVPDDLLEQVLDGVSLDRIADLGD